MVRLAPKRGDEHLFEDGPRITPQTRTGQEADFEPDGQAEGPRYTPQTRTERDLAPGEGASRPRAAEAEERG